MTVERLQRELTEILSEGKVKPDFKVCFNHRIHDLGSYHSEVDYILTEQKPGAIVLCYDDGHF